MKIPPTLQVGTTGFGSRPENADGVRIYLANVSEPLQNPHITIIILTNSDKTLDQEANANYLANINHKGIPATSIEKIHQDTFLNKTSYKYSFKNKGFISPHEEYVGYEGIYKVIWTEVKEGYIMIAFNDTLEINQILSTFRFD